MEYSALRQNVFFMIIEKGITYELVMNSQLYRSDMNRYVFHQL